MTQLRVLAVLALAAFSCGCQADLGACDIVSATSPIYYDRSGLPAYPGQALMDESCAASECHTQGIEPIARSGAPAGLDLDVGAAVSPDDVERLRRARRVAWNLRHNILQQVESGGMPPPRSDPRLVNYQAHRNTPEQRDLPDVQSPEGIAMLHNWLACGAHVIEAVEGVSQGIGDIVARGVDASCPAGQATCDGGCIDVSSDLSNCGGCGVTCGAAQGCVDAACACLNALDACGPECVDLQTDVSNCGGCGDSCGARFCADNMCVDSCPGSTTDCGGSCVDLTSNLANCGGCGAACGAGELCDAGRCSCAAGFELCTGACVDLNTDTGHCGGCGMACDVGAECSSGACACPGSTTLCGGACTDTATDTANCGGCANVCAPGEGCAGGSCVGCGPAVSFTNDIEGILDARCTDSGCHGGGRPAANLDLTTGRSFGELVGPLSSCGSALVTPGDVDGSYLWNKLTGAGMCSGTQMPKRGESLAQAELDAIRSWICQGAADD